MSSTSSVTWWTAASRCSTSRPPGSCWHLRVAHCRYWLPPLRPCGSSSSTSYKRTRGPASTATPRARRWSTSTWPRPDSLWPRFASQAVSAGFRSAHALPLRLRGLTIGALNLFRADEGALDAPEVTAVQGLADIATIAIIQHRVTIDAQKLNSQLSEALNSRITIEQAKGKISQAANVDMEHAFQMLRRHARSHNLRLSDLATDVASGTMDPASLDPLR